MIKRFSFILAGLIFFGIGKLQADVSVTAKLDSVNLLMGNVTTLHLEVVENKGTKGEFPILKPNGQTMGYSTVCGDSIEISTDFKVDTVDLGSGKLQLNYSVPIQAFDSGSYALPKFIYVSGKDTAYSNSLYFNVIPVVATADDPIAGFAPVAEPDGKKFYDWVPDWLLDFWWLWLIIFLAVALFLWGMKRYGQKGLPLLLSKPEPTSWDKALSKLKALKERKLWEQGLEKEYFTDLTDILRAYLYERFGINAMEMTTRQIMDKIMASDFKDKKDYVRHILNVADFVKFAKVRPLPADSISAYDNAVKFVEETIPQAAVEKSEDEMTKGGEDS